MHLMVYHYFLKKYRSLKIFTGQGVERNNDFARTTVLNKSNNWNAPADVLRMEPRQWALSTYEKNKRRYTRPNTDYWETELHEVRKKKGRHWQKLTAILNLCQAEISSQICVGLDYSFP